MTKYSHIIDFISPIRGGISVNYQSNNETLTQAEWILARRKGVKDIYESTMSLKVDKVITVKN